MSDAKKRRVQGTLLEVLSITRSLEAVIERYGKPLVTPVYVRSVTFRNDISETHTVIHIIACDRKGLLYRLTHEIDSLGRDIQTAKIGT